MNRSGFTNLRNVLAALYPDEPSIRRIIADAGIDLARIAFGAGAINIWHSVLLEAEHIYQVDVLLDVVEREYGINQGFRQACAAYRTSRADQTFLPKPSSDRFHPARARRPMPDHLPFLVNRHEQEDELGKALRRVGQKPDKPVICLAPGHKDQCHDMFVERLKRVSLPRGLGLPRDQDTIMVRTLRWPRVSNLHENLEMQLAQELCYNTLATTDDISEVLAKGPVLLHFHLSDKEWLHGERAVVTEFLDFWQKWPLKPGQHLFICLCIEHQTQSSVRRIWRWPWETKRRQSDPLETAMAQVITFVSSARFERLICIPLPQLGDVKFDDVKYWALSEEIQILRRHDLLTEIRLLFDQWERQMATQAMPMERIAAALKDILPKYLA